MNVMSHTDVRFRVDFYPRELREDAHLDRYVCSVTRSNLEEAREAAQLYCKRGFNVAIWKEEEIGTRIEIMEGEECRGRDRTAHP